MSGIGYSRISVVLGAVRTAANTFSATFLILDRHRRLVPAVCVVVVQVYKDVDARHKVYPRAGREAGPEGRARRVAMLGFTTKSPDHAAALERVRDWTRARFALAGDDTVMVAVIFVELTKVTELKVTPLGPVTVAPVANPVPAG